MRFKGHICGPDANFEHILVTKYRNKSLESNVDEKTYIDITIWLIYSKFSFDLKVITALNLDSLRFIYLTKK